MVILDYSFELENKLSELKTLREHIRHYGNANGLSDPCLLDINVCLDEIITNIVSYGFMDASPHLIKCNIKAVGNDLIIEVEDDGIQFNPLELENPKIPEDLVDLDIGGLGIQIVKKLMDEVSYSRKQGKNKLTLKKCIKR